MMKFAVTALFVILGSTSSQAKMTSTERVFLRQEQQKLNTPTRTRSVLVHALPKTHRKFVVTNDLTDDENDGPPGADELDLQVSYRRPDIVKDTTQDQDVSDYVKVRLLVARARAMKKYQEIWG